MRLRLSGLAAAATLTLATLAAAAVNGAIYTSVADGTTVNANIYDEKEEVFLSGGPQNHQSAGLSPDGAYYFQVTDPSGAVLLSTDDISCRVVQVTGGRIVGVPADSAGGFGTPACYHAIGTFNAANAALPVQLMPYLDTPNPGGEYKAWLTPVAAYGSCDSSRGSHGFCDSESKTDNFKVRASAPEAAYVSVCKFNDVDADGQQGATEPFIPHWPITATGVDGGTISGQTDDSGCVTFTFSGFSETLRSQTVTLSEGSFGPDWTQTAPTSCGTVANCAVENGVITLTVAPGEDVAAPNFGNTNPYCTEGCTTSTLVLTANAFTRLTRTYTWDIEKTVDQPRINTASPAAAFTYTVAVSHDAGTDSDWQANGSIRISNPGGVPIAGEFLATTDNGGSCALVDGPAVNIPAGSHVDVAYVCDFTQLAAPGTLSVLATWGTGNAGATAPIDFAAAAVNVVDGVATVTDSVSGPLGTVSSTDASPASFEYTASIDGVPGSCVTRNNVATFVADTSGATGSAQQAVELCVGADLLVTSSATTAFSSAIDKAAQHSVIQTQAGTQALNYTVRVTESGWVVSGLVQVTNPNDWQAVTATAASSVDGGGACSIDGAIVVPASSTVTMPYTCTFAAAPTAASGQNAATATWDAAAAYTPTGGATDTTPFVFDALTVTDTFEGVTTTLGVISAPAALTTLSYTKSVTTPAPATCRAFSNTATIDGRDQASSASVTVCNTTTGAHTIGFWQNKNGQAIVTSGTSPVCALTPWLRLLAPFQDLAATANCRTVGTYVTTVIKAASAKGAAMNAMLKAQMLASALDVYFSDPSLGGNLLGAPVRIGAVRIDLSGKGAAFGGAASLSVAQMLAWQNTVATSAGTSWYGNDKRIQELAKNAFDQINNQVAPIAH